MKYVIPDIHGGFRALKQCLEIVNFDYENDELITIGDYFDGWSESILVIEELLKIKNRVCLMGNHDSCFVQDYLLNRLSNKRGIYKPSDMDIWLENRGKSTKYEIDSNPDKKEMLISFLSNCKYYHIDEFNNIYVHAGFDPSKSIESQYPHDLIWDRKMANFIKDAVNFKDGYGSRHFKLMSEWNHIYLGHTYCGEIPLTMMNVTLLDSGCGYSDGKLNIMNIETGEWFQSSLLSELYKDYEN